MLLLLFLPLFVQGQTLSGYVRDSKGAAVGYANVTTLNAHDKMMTYAISKDDGSFTIQLPDSTVSVSVSALGYRTLVTPHKSVSDGMTFTLVAEAYHLKEVVVKSHRIQSHSDTLTYSVAGFRQKQDRSIGDVIAKMPGLEVSSDGTVKYQGKAINKYYVEGLDLLGRQYGMGNKNIPADKIVSVQVLQNHQPVKSLRGVQFSDQAALNLVLRDDARDVWSGATDLGAGWGDKLVYDNRLMALQLGRCFQTLMLYKNNNTGKDISREVKDLIKDKKYEEAASKIDEVKKIIEAHSDTLFVIRAHPDETRPGKESHETVSDWVRKNQMTYLPNVIYVPPEEYLSSYELIRASKFIMVYNSTIGLEAAVMGAAVLCGGRSRYTQVPLCYFPKTIPEYLEKAEELLKCDAVSVPDSFRMTARRFMYYQFFHTALSFETFIEPDETWKGYVKIRSFPAEALDPEKDPVLRVIRDGILDGKPFVLPDENKEMQEGTEENA